jgi:hypothetical protein
MGAIWPWARRLLLIVGGTYLVLGVLAWIFQRRLVYFPDRGPVVRPGGGDLAAIVDVEVVTADGVRLEAWHLPGKKPVTILVFHGNAGHRGHRTGIVRELAARGFGVFLPDYRGYGGSGGEPSEEGLYADAEACAAWLEANVEGEVVYLGNSIGAGVAVHLAVRRPPAAMVLRSGFGSMADVGQEAYPFFPVRWFLRERYESAKKMAGVRCPCLVVHGDADRIIPLRHGRVLFDAAPEPKQWLVIPDAGHNDLELVGGAAYWDAVAAFLDAGHVGGR